jgi:hypothetical protein
VFFLRPRRNELDCFLDQGGQIERALLDVDPAGLDLGKIENLLDQREQEIARSLHCVGIGRLLRRQRGIEQQLRHAQDAVERGADLVRYHCQEPRFCTVGGFRLVAGIGQCVLRLDSGGDVASDGLHLRMLAGADHDFAPGDPPRAVRRRDLLIMDAGGVGKERGIALLEDAQRHGAPEQLCPAASAQPAKGIIGVGDGARTVMAHDDVALGFQQTARALLRLLELPVSVRKILGAKPQLAALATRRPQVGDKQSDDAASRSEQRRATDGEGMRIVGQLRICHRRQKSECRGK